MSMKSYLGILAAMAAISPVAYTETGLSSSNPLKPENIRINTNKPVPKGCRRYFYNREGICDEFHSEIYFDCLKPSKARDKYHKWLETIKT